MFCPGCGTEVAHPAREGGLVLRKSLYDPASGTSKAICPNTRCKQLVPIPRGTPPRRLVIQKGKP